MSELNLFILGKHFKEKYNGYQFVKLTNEEEEHHNYKFRTGLNVDPNIDVKQNRFGFSFCEITSLGYWIEYDCQKMV